MSASQRHSPFPDPLLLRFPGLCFKEKRPLTEEELQRLERLAAPKVVNAEQAAPKEPHSFSPTIGQLWQKDDWEGTMCKHEPASSAEVDAWFPQLAGCPPGKKRERLQVQAMKSIVSCGHTMPQDGLICIHCKFRLCEECFEKSCKHRIKIFLKQTDQEKLVSMQTCLHLAEWEAKALLRGNTPVVQRLFSKAPRGKKRACGKAKDVSNLSDTGQVCKQHSLQQYQAMPTPAFVRLTTPRQEKVVTDIPYLPNMSKPLPELSDLGIDTSAVAEPLEDALQRLAISGKVTTWQAGALLRCAAPVFERLYDSKKQQRYEQSCGKEGADGPPAKPEAAVSVTSPKQGA